MVEFLPSKQDVAGSNPVSRSGLNCFAHVAQSVEHFHGKEKVTSSILVVGSKNLLCKFLTEERKT